MLTRNTIILAIVSMMIACAPALAEPHHLKKFGPSVVNIFTLEIADGYIRAGEGSGSIISNQGYIGTNNHVIQGMTEVRISLVDQREFDVDVVLTDPVSDVAVLKALRAEGWRTLVIWECETKDAATLSARLRRFLR